MRSVLLSVVVPLFILSVAVKADDHGDAILSEYLWSETTKEQEESLNSSLIRGMASTKLNPTSFGSYVVQDSVYIYNTYRIIGLALQKSKDSKVRQLLQKMSESYKGLSEHMLEAWSIKYTSGIHLGKACSNYLDHLYDMAINYDAVYFVTAMLPCYKLWPWLGKQLTAKQNDFGVYTQWVEENLDPTYTGYIDLEALINEAETHGRINRKMALTVFKRSMENERDFFSSVP